MLRRLLLIACALFLLVGFTSQDQLLKEQLKNLPYHYSQFDVKMSWDFMRVGDHSVIDGVVQNVRYSKMEGLEIWVMAKDSKDKETFRSVGFVIPHDLRLDELTTFSVKLPIVPPSGTKLVIMYKYEGSDGGGGGGRHGLMGGGAGGTNWMQSFDFVVP